MTDAGAPASALASGAPLWLALQQRLATRAAHDVKNALNGLAVNLEVVRARAARGDGGERIASFADTAAEQLEGVVSLVEALLGLARPARAPADGGGAAGALRGLAPLLAACGRPLEIESDGTEPTPALDGETLRVVVTGALLAVVEGEAGDDDGGGAGAPLRCTVAANREGGTRVHIAGARPAEVSPELRRLAGGAGVQVAPAPRGIELTIPALETQ